MFAWYRETVTPESYKKLMELPESEEKTEFELNISDDGKTISIPQETIDALYGSKHLSAYNVASDIRKFEIGLFWQRALFFWGFITVTYTAYFSVLKEFYKEECGARIHGTFPLVVLSALGLFFCFSWLLSSKASKHWQENWENHLDLLENDVTGPLYKIYQTKSYSVSKIAIAAGWTVSFLAYGLLIFEFANLMKRILGKKDSFPLALALLFAVLVPLCLFAYSRFVLGNLTNNGEIEFKRKRYKEFEDE